MWQWSFGQKHNLHKNESGTVPEHQKDEKSGILSGMFTLLNIHHTINLPVVRHPRRNIDPFLDVDIRDALWQVILHLKEEYNI